MELAKMTQKRILIIDDDEGQARLTRLQLEQVGYEVRSAAHGDAGIRVAREWKPHLILLDVLMPDMNGWDVYQQLREFTTAPVCFMTALGEEQDILRGLDLGADDYIVKPYGYKELVARVHAAFRRSDRTNGESPLELGTMRIDPRSYRVWLNGHVVTLTPTEFRLLLALARRAGQVVTHEELLQNVWGSNRHSMRGSLKLYICYLRRKLERYSDCPCLIVSERGVGYRLSAPENPS